VLRIPIHAVGFPFHMLGIRFCGNSEGSAVIGGYFEGFLGNYNCWVTVIGLEIIPLSTRFCRFGDIRCAQLVVPVD